MNASCTNDVKRNEEDIFPRIIGYENIKNEMRPVIDLIVNRGFYQKLGAKVPGGLMFFGEPGVGKTLLANSFIEACGLPVFVCRRDKPTPEFIEFIKETFARARAQAPSIVLLDDLDKFANDDEEHTDSEEFVTVQSCIDAVRGSGVLVLATANDLDCLPESLLRSGRFDSIIHIPAPSYRDAVKIFQHYLDGRGLSRIDGELVARLMADASCADLESIANEAALIAAYNRDPAIETEHFIKACLKVKFRISTANYSLQDVDASRLSAMQQDDDDYRETLRIAYHEAGHVVVGETLSPGSVTLVSLRGQDSDKGGFASHFRGQDRDVISAALEKVAVSLGGRAAVELKFGELCSGSADDLDTCYSVIKQLICQECIRSLEHYRVLDRWGRDEPDSRTKAVIIQEVEKCCQNVKEILISNSAFLDRLAAALMEKGLLLRGDIARIKEEAKAEAA